MNRRNYLYSLPPNRLSAAASVVAAELRQTVRELVASGAWAGVEPIDPGTGTGKDDRGDAAPAPRPGQGRIVAAR